MVAIDFQRFDFAIFPSLAFLFGIAAQFSAMDGHAFLRKMVGVLERKVGIVYAVVLVVGVFSPFILNDVVILILTPVVVRYAKHFGVDAAPLVVAEITFTNTASSLTPFGNPQNILLWASSGASFAQFVGGTWLAVALSALLAGLALLPFGLRTGGAREIPSSLGSVAPLVYLLLVAVTIFITDLVGLPSYVSLGLGFFMGFPFTFRSLSGVAKSFDLKSLLTLYAFVVSIAVAGALLMPVLVSYIQPVAAGMQPYSALFVCVVSNLISNVPATQLVLSVASVPPAMASKIAVEAGFAGNISPVASFANILALQTARKGGLPLRRTIALQFAVGIISFIPALM